MTDKNIQCPKCGGEMLLGFVPDYVHGYIYIGNWHAGPPQKSFWYGTQAHRDDGLPIGAFRCQKCGFLEFYSDAKFAAQ